MTTEPGRVSSPDHITGCPGGHESDWCPDDPCAPFNQPGRAARSGICTGCWFDSGCWAPARCTCSCTREGWKHSEEAEIAPARTPS